MTAAQPTDDDRTTIVTNGANAERAARRMKHSRDQAKGDGPSPALALMLVMSMVKPLLGRDINTIPAADRRARIRAAADQKADAIREALKDPNITTARIRRMISEGAQTSHQFTTFAAAVWTEDDDGAEQRIEQACARAMPVVNAEAVAEHAQWVQSKTAGLGDSMTKQKTVVSALLAERDRVVIGVFFDENGEFRRKSRKTAAPGNAARVKTSVKDRIRALQDEVAKALREWCERLSRDPETLDILYNGKTNFQNPSPSTIRRIIDAELARQKAARADTQESAA